MASAADPSANTGGPGWRARRDELEELELAAAIQASLVESEIAVERAQTRFIAMQPDDNGDGGEAGDTADKEEADSCSFDINDSARYDETCPADCGPHMTGQDLRESTFKRRRLLFDCVMSKTLLVPAPPPPPCADSGADGDSRLTLDMLPDLVLLRIFALLRPEPCSIPSCLSPAGETSEASGTGGPLYGCANSLALTCRRFHRLYYEQYVTACDIRMPPLPRPKELSHLNQVRRWSKRQSENVKLAFRRFPGLVAFAMERRPCPVSVLELSRDELDSMELRRDNGIRAPPEIFTAPESLQALYLSAIPDMSSYKYRSSPSGQLWPNLKVLALCGPWKHSFYRYRNTELRQQLRADRWLPCVGDTAALYLHLPRTLRVLRMDSLRWPPSAARTQVGDALLELRADLAAPFTAARNLVEFDYSQAPFGSVECGAVSLMCGLERLTLRCARHKAPTQLAGLSLPLTALKEVDIEFAHMTGETMSQFCEGLPVSLTSLRIALNRYSLNCELAGNSLRHLQSLVKLELSRITMVSWDVLLPIASGLTHLSLVQCSGLFDVDRGLLLSRLGILQDLKLEGCDGVRNHVLAMIPNVGCLERIVLTASTALSDKGFAAGIASYGSLESVRELGLDLCTYVGDEVARAVGERMPNLESLHLQSTQVSGSGVEAIVAGCKRLRVLGLSRCSVGDGSVAALGQLGNLEELDMRYVELSRNGLYLLAQGPCSRALARLGLPFSADPVQASVKFSNDAWEEITIAFANRGGGLKVEGGWCEIVW